MLIIISPFHRSRQEAACRTDDNAKARGIEVAFEVEPFEQAVGMLVDRWLGGAHVIEERRVVIADGRIFPYVTCVTCV